MASFISASISSRRRPDVADPDLLAVLCRAERLGHQVLQHVPAIA
jgi:hypothetical protein